MDNVILDMIFRSFTTAIDTFRSITFMGVSMLWFSISVAIAGIIITYLVNVARNPKVSGKRKGKKKD